MSTLLRTFRNLRKIGIKEYAHQMQNIGDTKVGTYIASDRYGNKYFENLEQELPLRTRWVDYKDQEYSPCQIDPGWHAWMSYLVDKPPTEDALLRTQQRAWELPEHRANPTQTRAAYKPYSTGLADMIDIQQRATQIERLGAGSETTIEQQYKEQSLATESKAKSGRRSARKKGTFTTDI